MKMDIRKIKKNELEKFKKMQNYAFGKWKDKIEEKDDIFDWFKNAENIGVFKEDELVSGLIIHDFEQIVRKDVKKMGGIGGVATYPEHRKKGYISKLMEKSFKIMKENCQSVSMLLPFKESFYEKYNYVTTNNNMKLEVNLKSLKHYQDYSPEGEWEEIREPSIQSREAYLSFIREVALKKYQGYVLVDRKSEGIWNLYSKNNLIVFIKRDDEIVATAKYTKKGFQDVFETGIIDIGQIMWKDIDARNMLFKYFAKHLDQIEKIKMYIPYGVNFYSWFKNNCEIKADIHQFPWMVRIIDVENALNNIEITEQGSLIISVEDKFCDWNNKTFKLENENNSLKVEETDQKEDLVVSIDGISALLYGAYSLVEIEHLYNIKYYNENKREFLKKWFPERMIFNTSFF